MTRDEIIALAGELSKGLHDPDTLDTFTDEVFRINGTHPLPHLVKAYIKALTSGTGTYDFEADMLRIIYAIMHDELLSPCEEPALDAYSASWQAATGTPKVITQDTITARKYRLYPEPDFTSSPLIPTHGEPFGEDFPTNSLVLIYADDREDNIAPIYAIPIALDALSMEFTYPSDHTDPSFAATAQGVAQLIYRLLGAVR